VPGFVAGLLGLPTGSLIANVPSANPASVAQPDGSRIPSQGLSVQVPSVSPNMGFGVGVPGSTSLGPTGTGTARGHTAGVPMSLVPSFPDPPFVSPRVSDPIDPTIPDPTFPDVPAVPNYPDVPSNFPDVPTNPDPDPTDPSPPTDPTAPDAPTDASPPSGDAPSGPGPGDAGTGPTGDGPSGGVFKRGGKVQQERAHQRGQRPDPHKLSRMLKAGSRVNVGDNDDETDDVGVRLTKGEIVVNKAAAREFGPELEQMNAWGRRAMGGMGVGPSSTPRSTGHGGRAGGFGVTGRPRDERR
jgi:hypothetical protein